MRDVEDLLRDLAPQVLVALVHRYGDFDTCEDAVQEALLTAALQWPDGLPDNPKSWLITVASRRRIELWRGDTARRRREESVVALAPPPNPEPPPAEDDTLHLLMLCCHPALTTPSQVALTLRAVGGLTTAEIARAFLVPESTIGQRISRAKARIKAEGAHFRMPAEDDRLAGVLHVLYLIFTEGHTASAGDAVNRIELTAEAIRLTRQLHAQVPDDGEIAGLLALMLLTDARRPARTHSDGTLVPLAEQDRSRWNASAIAEGVALVTETMSTAVIGPYQLQAAIAAVHDEAPTADETDWHEILGLYEVLATIAPGPMVTLNRVVALGMARDPGTALTELARVESELDGHYRVDAVRAHLLERAGDREAARAQYERAAQRTLSVPERRYLSARAAALS